MEVSQHHAHPVILFDGVCNLCNGFVQFVIKRDKQGIFKFSALNSKVAAELLSKLNDGRLPAELPDTVVLIMDGQIFLKSEAAIRILKKLKGLKWLGTIYRFFPLKFRDWIYDFVASRRYRWFGRKDHCMIPSPETANRFL
jgi:predicted DCC family thiol-disulfide oxidoreductase YuxK